MHDLNWKGSSIIERGSHPVAIESKVEQIILMLDDPTIPIIAFVSMGSAGKHFLCKMFSSE